MPVIHVRPAPLTVPRISTAVAFVVLSGAALFLLPDYLHESVLQSPSLASSRSSRSSLATRLPPRELRAPLFILSVVASAFLLFVGPISQDPSYHDFADRRGYRCGCCGGAGGFGGFVPRNEDDGDADSKDDRSSRRRRGFVVPNFSDVASNVVILLGGLAGLAALALDDDAYDAWQRSVCLPLFFGATVAISVGSAYYHWNPTGTTLVYDRLPMTVAFMAIFAFLLDDRIRDGVGSDSDVGQGGTTGGDDGRGRVGPLLLTPLVVLGASSVLYWHIMDDLRPYALVQFMPLLSVPALLALYPPKYTGQEYIVAALVWYIVAKVCEVYDGRIYEMTGRRVSGHTLKHVTAGLVPFCIARMVLVREPLP